MTAAKVVSVSGPSDLTRRGPWSSLEVRTLRDLATLGAKAIAVELGRPVTAVEKKASRLGISLRQPGSKVGLLLGQPPGTSWTDARELALTVALHAQIRADVAAGRLTVADLERAHAALTAGVADCPACVRNPADHPDGLCTACHRRRLSTVHRAALDAHDAQQELWSARQAASRSRRKKGPR